MARRTFWCVAALLAGMSPWRLATGAAPEPVAPYAVVDWIDPLNPKFVRLTGARFLLTTYNGLVVWDAQANHMAPARGWPAHTRATVVRSVLGNGAVIAGASHTAQDAPYGALVWWDAPAETFADTLSLPPGTVVNALVALDAGHALACLRTGVLPDGAEYEGPTQARVLTLDAGRLAWDGTAAARALLWPAGIRGVVDGHTTTGDATPAPVVFNTARCKWEARVRPAQFGDMADPWIEHHRLPDGRVVLSQTTGYSPSGQHHLDLRVPLLWDAPSASWTPIAAPAMALEGPAANAPDSIDDPVIAGGNDTGFAEYLDPATLRWKRAQQQYSGWLRPDVVALGRDSALAFLRERGHVLRLTWMTAPPPGRFAYRHYPAGAVALAGGGLLLLNGGAQDHPSSYAELLRPGAGAVRITPPPAPWYEMHGVELADRSVLALGGAPPCAAHPACTAPLVQPGYRYFPAQDRWEEVPGLALRPANREPGADPAKGLSYWQRTDVLVRRDGDVVYLDGPPAWQRESDDATPWLATLQRWSPGAAPQTLATLPRWRAGATVLELADGRLAVVGGVAHQDDGATADSRAVDLFDPRRAAWVAGPAASHPGGRAFKLANGKIIKLTGVDWNGAHLHYDAELADPALRAWKKLPPLPLKDQALVAAVAAGNRLLLQVDGASHTVVWDDDAGRWRTWRNWSRLTPRSIHPLDVRRALVRDAESYEIVPFPIP